MTSTRIPAPSKNSHAPPPAPPSEPWTIEAARTLYNIEGWGIGFFDINEAGHVVVRPDREKTDRELDLFELANDLEEQGVGLPLLLRFSDILRSRIESLNKVYGTSILVSEATYEQVKDEFPRAREIDRIRVRGRSQVAGLYEIIPEGKYGDLDWLGEFAEAYKVLQGGDPARAAKRFEALHAITGDPVSAFHVQAFRAPRRRRDSDF